MSGCVANPTPNTRYEPKFCSYMNEEHTPINLPDSHKVFRTQEHPAAASKHVASRVPSMFGPSSLWKQMAGHVSGRPGLQETGAVSERESVVSTIFSSQSKEKRDRDQNVVHSFRDRENLHKILERKVDSAVRGERMAQQKLCEAEAEVEARNWEKKKIRLCFSADQSRI